MSPGSPILKVLPSTDAVWGMQSFSPPWSNQARSISQDNVNVYGSLDGTQLAKATLPGQKDRWPMGLFQYGNAFLPDGNNSTGLLAVNTIAVKVREISKRHSGRITNK